MDDRTKVLLIAGAGVAFIAIRSAQSAYAGLGGWLSSIAGGVSGAVGAAVDAVYQPENAVSAGAGGNLHVVDYNGVGDITPLVNYFDRYGNTVATRNEARSKGWTTDQISLAVATVGSMNGYY